MAGNALLVSQEGFLATQNARATVTPAHPSDSERVRIAADMPGGGGEGRGVGEDLFLDLGELGRVLRQGGQINGMSSRLLRR